MAQSGATAGPSNAADLTISGQTAFGTKVQVGASQAVVDDILKWMHGNQVQFIGILVLIGWWIQQTRKGKTERASDKLEFERLRRDIRAGAKNAKEKKK